MALTAKKKAFAEAVLAGFSNKEAAIKAGYSAATASPAGSRLVKDKVVVEYLKKMRAAGAKQPAAMSKPAFDVALATQHQDPKAFLLAAMNDIEIEPKERINAAKALLPLFHGKVPDGGKKGDQKSAAEKAAGGRFAPAAPPLKLVGKR